MWGMFICEIRKIKSSLFQPDKWTDLEEQTNKQKKGTEDYLCRSVFYCLVLHPMNEESMWANE